MIKPRSRTRVLPKLSISLLMLQPATSSQHQRDLQKLKNCLTMSQARRQHVLLHVPSESLSQQMQPRDCHISHSNCPEWRIALQLAVISVFHNSACCCKFMSCTILHEVSCTGCNSVNTFLQWLSLYLQPRPVEWHAGGATSSAARRQESLRPPMYPSRYVNQGCCTESRQASSANGVPTVISSSMQSCEQLHRHTNIHCRLFQAPGMQSTKQTLQR